MSPASGLLLRFLSVGGLGFLLDASLFQALYLGGTGPILARAGSATAAITLTWYLNRHWAFRTGKINRGGPEYLRYLGVQTVGLVINFGVYLVLLQNIELFAKVPLLALCGGASSAIAFNFLAARCWVFRSRQP